MPNSFPMEGRAILIEEPMKGTKKEGRVVANKTAFLSIRPDESMLPIIIEWNGKAPISKHQLGSGYAGLGFICYNKGAMRKIYIPEV